MTPPNPDAVAKEFTHFRCLDCGFRGAITMKEIGTHRLQCSHGTTIGEAKPDEVAPIPDEVPTPEERYALLVSRMLTAEAKLAHAEQRAAKAEAERDEAAARIEALEKAPEELIFYAAGLIQEKYLLDARAALNPPEEQTDAKPVKETT